MKKDQKLRILNSTALYIAIAITGVYAIAMTAIYGWQKSYSDTYYTQKIGWIFQAWCWALGLLLFIALYKEAPAIMVSTFGFIVVGAAAKMREKWQRPIHFYGAVLTMVGGCLALMQVDLVSGLIATCILSISATALFIWKPKNYFFWLESLAFLIIYTYLI